MAAPLLLDIRLEIHVLNLSKLNSSTEWKMAGWTGSESKLLLAVSLTVGVWWVTDKFTFGVSQEIFSTARSLWRRVCWRSRRRSHLEVTVVYPTEEGLVLTLMIQVLLPMSPLKTLSLESNLVWLFQIRAQSILGDKTIKVNWVLEMKHPHASLS